MNLTFRDAERIADGTLSTATVFGLDEAAVFEGRLSDASAKHQIDRFVKRLEAKMKASSQLQHAPTEIVGFGAWLQSIRKLPTDASPSAGLRKLVEREFRQRADQELFVHLKVYLVDNLLSQAEHKSMVILAKQFGLDEAYVRDIYARWRAKNGAFDEETEAQAAQKQTTGWKAHKRLAPPGELGGWTLDRVQDLLLQRFDIALEIANLSVTHKDSLFTYLEDKDDPTMSAAKAGQELAEQFECRPLAVWYYLWATGRPKFHVGGKKGAPVRDRHHQVSNVEELEALIASEHVLDDLCRALQDGLLGSWLALVARPGDEESRVLAEKYRDGSRSVPESKRDSYLRYGLLQVLRSVGLEGLPLWDASRRPVYVKDLPSLVDHAEDCWSALEWCLHSGALAEWLDGIDPKQAARARECALLGDQ